MWFYCAIITGNYCHLHCYALFPKWASNQGFSSPPLSLKSPRLKSFQISLAVTSLCCDWLVMHRNAHLSTDKILFTNPYFYVMYHTVQRFLTSLHIALRSDTANRFVCLLTRCTVLPWMRRSFWSVQCLYTCSRVEMAENVIMSTHDQWTSATNSTHTRTPGAK